MTEYRPSLTARLAFDGLTVGELRQFVGYLDSMKWPDDAALYVIPEDVDTPVLNIFGLETDVPEVRP